MFLQQAESNGPAMTATDGPVQGPDKPLKEFTQKSSSLPFGQEPELSSIGGPTYSTTQSLVQQVAYTLSDRLWTYSPETFDLDVAVKGWFKEGAQNAHGYAPNVESMQIRQGAVSITLGYMFSKDFDLERRHIPQTVLALSSSLPYLHSALDQLSLLYSIANPFVAHIAAVGYAGGASSLVTDYVSTIELAEDLGFALIASPSTHESQHMALFATLLASTVPTIHTYDGITAGRETTRVIDVLDQTRLYHNYTSLLEYVSSPQLKNLATDVRVERLLEGFNRELGTEYGLFEYHGHSSPDAVLVTFGTVESSLSVQVAKSLGKGGACVGVLNVRIYRPFVEEEFLRLLPTSTKIVGVLGQVGDGEAVANSTVSSALYGDVVAAITFSATFQNPPSVIDIKYPRESAWTSVSMAAAFQLMLKKPVLEGEERSEIHEGTQSLELLDPSVQQFVFWDLDDSPSVSAPLAFGSALARDSSSNITSKTCHDNLTEGGLVKTEIRRSKQSIDAPYSVNAADMIYIGDAKLLERFDVVRAIKPKGKILLRFPGIKDDEMEKKLPEKFRHDISIHQGELFIFDPSAIEQVSNDPALETYLLQSAFLRVGLPNLEKVGLDKIASVNGSHEVLMELAKQLEHALRKIEVPEDWKATDTDSTSIALPGDIKPTNFVAFDKTESEPPSYLRNWTTAAKGLAFREAYGTKTALRPDLAIKTHTVRVMENRRLTPPTYDRNIFHIEFDLGETGLKYEIGEALGIHAENDEVQVEEFIRFYKLDPEEIVEVPSREDASVLENRTVWQALMQNVDIFGRPPKRFYEALAEFADDPSEIHELQALGGPEGANEFKRRGEVDTVTYADILLEFPSAHPSFHDIVRIVNPMKRREYSIASCQKVTPNSVALMIVVVGWVDPKGRDRFGQATRFLNKLKVGVPVTVSIKPSVMKLPPKSTQPLIMAGLGTGLAPFRAFVQHRAWEKAQGREIGSVLLYMGSRHQREEYCYGEEWEAYQDAGVITLLGRAFSRDQPQKIYIQDRMRQTMDDIIQAYLKEDGAFYLCGPTWPVPDVTNVLEDAIAWDAKALGKKTDPHKEIERLKDQLRYVLERCDLMKYYFAMGSPMCQIIATTGKDALQGVLRPGAKICKTRRLGITSSYDNTTGLILEFAHLWSASEGRGLHLKPPRFVRRRPTEHVSYSPKAHWIMNTHQESASSAKRPQLNDRSPSSQSLSRASPSTGKGSTAKLHKAHGVGHGRHPHGRNPSSKNLSKLGKGASTHAHDEHSKTKAQSKAKVQTPSTSPPVTDLKSISSHVSLPRIGSKVSIKKNASNLSQKRNKSSTKLGNLNKGARAGVEQEDSGKLGSNGAQFSIGSDDQDDGWVETGDSSQSPSAPKRASTAKRQARSPSPDEPPSRSDTNLPASPPESSPSYPPTRASRNHIQSSNDSNNDPHANHHNAEAVTNRLLHRNSASNIHPQTSNISATITPSGSNGSPAFNYSHDATLRNEPSMPPDGISRFLNATGTSAETEPPTPNSLSLKLHSKLSDIHRQDRQNGDSSTSAQQTPPTPPDAISTTAPSSFTRRP
ncbi:MAG: hypothetical protein Q9218_005467, partial [Villophora microphyllina]